MRPLEAREEREVINGNVAMWRPWQLKTIEIFQGVVVSIPSRQLLTQEHKITCIQSGTAEFQYRNTCLSGQVVDEMLLVIEPGEIWTSQAEDVHNVPPFQVIRPRRSLKGSDTPHKQGDINEQGSTDEQARPRPASHSWTKRW